MPELVATDTAKPSIVDQRWFVRLLEIIPGAVTWTVLLLPILLSFLAPVALAYFIIAFDVYWVLKSYRLAINLVRGYRRLGQAGRVDWNAKLAELSKQTDLQPGVLDPTQLINAVIIATYNESRTVLESSIKGLSKVDYPLSQTVLFLAYEERGGERVEQNAKELIEEYGPMFRYAAAIKHPDGMAGEVIGKGGNITWAGRRLAEWVSAEGIDPLNVIVTTFDSDHRPSRNYFSLLSYMYATDPNRTRRSFQPIPMFYNNIWDAPAPMRVIAAGNSFWLLMETMRPHRLRNFAAHAQSLEALIHTDFWSTSTIVEDGHQFWRTYFAYEGDHQVVPVYAPVYQDAVLAKTYWRTFKVQYLQLRRWAWGVSDFPFAVRNSIRHTRIRWGDKLLQIGRLFEGHFSWATAPLLLTFVAWLPLYLNHHFSEQLLAHQLPMIASYIVRLSLIGALVTVYISMLSLPPRPKRYRRSKFVAMVIQWLLLPLTALFFSSLAAIDSQTRLMLGKSLDFSVTEKARRE